MASARGPKGRFISKAIKASVAGGKTAAAAGGTGKIAGGIWKTIKSPQFGKAMGVFFILQMIMSQMKKHGQTLLIDQPLQRQQLEGQANVNPEDAYYQSMLPSLTGQRQSAQNALLQAILGSSGQTMSVPGERLIG